MGRARSVIDAGCCDEITVIASIPREDQVAKRSICPTVLPPATTQGRQGTHLVRADAGMSARLGRISSACPGTVLIRRASINGVQKGLNPGEDGRHHEPPGRRDPHIRIGGSQFLSRPEPE
jgi:hypothetical protein